MNRLISTGTTIMPKMGLIDELIIQRVFHCDYGYNDPALFYWKILEWLILFGRYKSTNSKSRAIHGPRPIRNDLRVGDPRAIQLLDRNDRIDQQANDVKVVSVMMVGEFGV